MWNMLKPVMTSGSKAGCWCEIINTGGGIMCFKSKHGKRLIFYTRHYCAQSTQRGRDGQRYLILGMI